MRRFAWIVTIPVTVIIIVFSVMNRQPVTIDLWPLPWEAAPELYKLTLGMILFGFLFGVAVMWFSAAKQRRRLREAKRDLDAARSELHTLRQRPATPHAAGTAVATTQTRLPPAA